jgi:hypothetical protein
MTGRENGGGAAASVTHRDGGRMADVEDGQEQPSFEAEYTLEYPLKCPHCKDTIQALQALRLARTRVNFISLLPRRGYVLACPACHGILSAELGGVLTRAV